MSWLSRKEPSENVVESAKVKVGILWKEILNKYLDESGAKPSGKDDNLDRKEIVI